MREGGMKKADVRFWLDKMLIHFILSEKLKEEEIGSLYDLIRAYEALAEMIGWDEIYTKSD